MDQYYGAVIVIAGINAMGFGYQAFWGDILSRETGLTGFIICGCATAISIVGLISYLKGRDDAFAQINESNKYWNKKTRA